LSSGNSSSITFQLFNTMDTSAMWTVSSIVRNFFNGSTALSWALTCFALLRRGSARHKAATYTQDSTKFLG
jgi:hypothetical protein